LFATPEPGAKNGFSLTGGILNYTAEVNYPDTGHKASIHVHFKVIISHLAVYGKLFSTSKFYF